MSKIENWGDLFKYNKELLEDDFNHGQGVVLKTKSKASDNVTEISSTFKQANVDSNGDGKVAFEAKFKSTTGNHSHEIAAKQDGAVSYEIKSNVSELTKVTGLQTIVQGTAWTTPATNAPTFKVGVEYNASNVKTKWLINPNTLNTEGNFTYLKCKYLFGANFLIDGKSQKLSKLDFGFNWAPAAGSNFGLLHAAVSDKPFALGKFWVYFNHAATSSQVVGTEFAYDWGKKVVEAKLGVSHKFNDATSGKFKIDQAAKVDAVLKHKYNETVTASLATGFDLNAVVSSSKSKKFPVGLAFDFKF